MSRYIAMHELYMHNNESVKCFYFISFFYGCYGGALVFLGGAEASASPPLAPPMFITIFFFIILHLFLGVPAATVGGTGTPMATPLIYTILPNVLGHHLLMKGLTTLVISMSTNLNV